MNKNKFLKVLLALFAVTLLAVSCADKPTDPEGDGETPDNPNLPELGITVTKGTETSPVEITFPAATEFSAVSESQSVTGEATIEFEKTLSGVKYAVKSVSSLEPSSAEESTREAASEPAEEQVKIEAANALKAGNYTVVENSGDATKLTITLAEEAVTAIKTALSPEQADQYQVQTATTKYGILVLDVTASKDGYKNKNIKLYVKVKEAAAGPAGFIR